MHTRSQPARPKNRGAPVATTTATLSSQRAAPERPLRKHRLKPGKSGKDKAPVFKPVNRTLAENPGPPLLFARAFTLKRETKAKDHRIKNKPFQIHKPRSSPCPQRKDFFNRGPVRLHGTVAPGGNDGKTNTRTQSSTSG